MTGPAVSVIIPTLNRPEMLAVALDSLTLQTMRDFEVIVVNDGGVDVTGTAATFGARGDSGFTLDIHVLHHPHSRGLSAARNTGLAAARGRLIAYLDDDDFYYEDHLEVLCGAFTAPGLPPEGQVGFSVVYADAVRALQRHVNGEYRTVSRRVPLSRPFDREELGKRNITPVLSVMHERACLDRCGGFAEYLRGHEDWDFWQRLARHYDFWHLNIAVAEFLARPDGGTLSSRLDSMRESWRFVRAQGELFSRVPPVVTLERTAHDSVILDPQGCIRPAFATPVASQSTFLTSSAPAAASHSVSVIVPCARWDEETRQRLLALCSHLDDAQLVVSVAAPPDEVQDYKRDIDSRLTSPAVFVCHPGEVGRVFAANFSAAAASGSWLLFLEETVIPQTPHWVAALLDAAKANPAAAALSPLLEDGPRGVILGGTVSAKGEIIFRRKVAPDSTSSLPASDTPASGPALSTDAAALIEVPCLSDLCLLVRRDCFNALGGFDPAFAPGHYADADLCFRLRRLGHSCFVAPAVRCTWNSAPRSLGLTPSGLIARRVFWDRHTKDLGIAFPLERAFTAADWPLRSILWASDGTMPRSLEFSPPSEFV